MKKLHITYWVTLLLLVFAMRAMAFTDFITTHALRGYVAPQVQCLQPHTDLILQQAENLSPQVLDLALIAYRHACAEGLDEKGLLTIIDYSKPSSEKRLWVIDLHDSRVLFHTLVAHGKDSGMLYEIEDSDDLEILQQNLIEFRAWMAERGYGDKPLVVSEYGILMPEDYGFPPETVERFLTGSFDLFQTLANETGYLPDDGRLVQWWFWYSLYDGDQYMTGDLYDPSSEQLTKLGQAWANYVTDLLVNE